MRCLTLSLTLMLAFLSSLTFPAATVSAQDMLIEAESFTDLGGWKLDTQSIQSMGSPYLLAHGLGVAVEDATTSVTLPEPGKYRVWVRTKDWVARWNAQGHPGRFQLLVDGQPLETTFGTQGKDWFWQDGGTVDVPYKTVTLGLHDLTGFDGRCDAIVFSKSDGANSDEAPPNSNDVLPGWRRSLLGLGNTPTELKEYDLVVVGGGYAGMGAAISAARMGCKVALIQDRPVLGGNGSSEVRVWAMGFVRRGKYPRVGEIVEEFSDRATKSPGSYEEFEDARKEAIIRQEKNIDLFLNHHAFAVQTDAGNIKSVDAFDTKTSEHKRFRGRFFVDCTGHGTIGALAGADYEMTPEGRMGMSNMWAWDEGERATEFPQTPWALDLKMEDFPYPRDHHGQWFWESGFNKDALGDAEGIRDWNLRAVYGAFNAMKNGDGAADHKNAFLIWIAYIGGPRESRRLMGDIVLTGDDVVAKKDFKDGCVPSTWSIDLHYPKEQYADKFPDNPFISVAKHDRRIDRNFGYPVPYRCFYSRNVGNLFMAGRNISVTHKALGTVRVMRTCGMMGEVVGKAVSVCLTRDCSPRDVYEKYWDQMDELLRMPGKANRPTIDGEFTIPADAMPLANGQGLGEGLDPASLPGVVVDDKNATVSKRWATAIHQEGFVGTNYLIAKPEHDSHIKFQATTPADGTFDIRIAYLTHSNRGTQVPVTIEVPGKKDDVTVNQQQPPGEDGFFTVGTYELKEGDDVTVTLKSAGAGGYVHADAIQILAK